MHLAYQKETNYYPPSQDQEPALPRENVQAEGQDLQIYQDRHNKNPRLEVKASKIVACL